MRRLFRPLVLVLLASVIRPPSQLEAQTRPFGTLRDQAATRQAWLQKRLTTVLPAVMRRHGVDAWVIPMREYNEDPMFSSLVSPTTFAARRRTIYVFFDKCAASGTTDPGDGSCVERIALGGTSQGGLYEARRAMAAVDAGAEARQAELVGAEQWNALRSVLEERDPKRIAINVSRNFAFSDGLTAGERDGMSEALGARWTSRFTSVDALALDFIATRLPEEAEFYRELQTLVWQLTERDVLQRGGHARRHAHERPRVVVAAAGERPRARDLVPAQRQRAAPRRERGPAGRRSHHPARRCAAL
jgi:hypothetical protein